MSDIRRYTPSEFISLDEQGELVKYEDHKRLLDAATQNYLTAEEALQGQRVLAHEVELLKSALESCLDEGGMTGADWVHAKAEVALAVVKSLEGLEL